MADDPKDPGTDPKDVDPGKTDPPETDPPEDDDDDDDADSDDKDKAPDPVQLKADLDKAVRQANRRESLLKKAQEELAALKNKDGKDDAPDPVATANARLVRSEAKTALAAVGVTDKELQKDVLDAINLSGVDVFDDGDVDTDALEELMGKLQKAFGKPPTKRTPRVDTRDKSGAGNQPPADPDKDRYNRFLTGTSR